MVPSTLDFFSAVSICLAAEVGGDAHSDEKDEGSCDAKDVFVHDLFPFVIDVVARTFAREPLL
jgi:hypothetical protein